jgi:hypothetical protein
LHGFSWNLDKHALVSFSKTSNSTRPSRLRTRAILRYLKNSLVRVISKLHSKPCYYIYILGHLYPKLKLSWNAKIEIVKDHVKFVLGISSAHNKWGPTDINIAQILHLSNFFELKRSLVYTHLQLRTRKVLDMQLVCLKKIQNNSNSE